MTKKERVIAVLVGINIALYVAHLYFPMLNSGFIWDDFFFYNAFGHPDSTLSSILHSNVFNGSNFFRPLGTLSFYIEYQLFGINPVAAHAVNIALQVCVALLVYALSLKLLSRRFRPAASILIAALFSSFICTLPITSEPVAWVAARFESLCAIFLILLTATQILAPTSKKKLFLIFWLSFLALCSKETAIVALPVVTLFQLLTHWEEYKAGGLKKCLLNSEFAGYAAAILAATICYGGFRYITQDGSGFRYDTFQGLSVAEYTSLIATTLKHWATFILMPWHQLLPFYPPGTTKTLTTETLLTLLAAIMAIMLTIIALFRRRSPMAGVAGILIITLLPATNLVPIYADLYSTASRYIYIPVLLSAIALIYSATMVEHKYSVQMHTKQHVFIPVLLVAGLTANYINTPKFIAMYSTNAIFWRDIASNVGVYHQKIAVNLIDSKLGIRQYKEALALYKELSAKKLLPPESDIQFRLITAYFNHQATPEQIQLIDSILADTEAKEKKKKDALEISPLWLYNTKAVMAIQLCYANDIPLKAAEKAESISKNSLSELIISKMGGQLKHQNDKVHNLILTEWLTARKQIIDRDIAQCAKQKQVSSWRMRQS